MLAFFEGIRKGKTVLQENQAYISNFEALIIALQLRSPSTNGPDVACDLFSKLTLSFTSLELYQSSYRMSVHTPPPAPPKKRDIPVSPNSGVYILRQSF